MFTLELLQAINDWQCGGSAKQKERRGKRLKEMTENLDPYFRQVELCCFRQLGLDPKYVWKLGDELHLSETISAWTLETEIAKSFKGGVPPEGIQGVIFVTTPKPENVIVNLPKLYRDPDFQAACEKEKDNINSFHKGIGRYSSSQSEVILEIDTLPLDSVYALGGSSSNKMDIARVFFGHEPNIKEMEFFDEILNKSKKSLGKNWITDQAKDRVLMKMLKTVERLKPHHKSE